MSELAQFFWERRSEIAALTGQHLLLVVASAAIAVAIGVPLGVVLTRRPRLSRPVLGAANVVQTIPSLALFGFLIPIPLLGGIGARTAIVALVVYGILPILQNTHAGIRSVDPAVVEASRTIASTHGQIALPALSRHTGFSREHLIRRFREQVGLTPKAYGNIVRFNRALELARAPASSWAEIAHSCGYYDQSHLVRDFQRFAGRAPATLLRDARPDAASIVIE